MNNYIAKGYLNYMYSGGEIIDFYRKFSNAEIALGMNSYTIYDLIDGKEFLEDVKWGGFIDYDGTLVDVFVDGYKSNLGLMCKGLCQGNFLVSANEWESICNNHKVEVNWANK